MKKVLFVATIHKHFRAFHIPYMKWFRENGYQVDIAAGGDDVDFEYIDNKFHIPVERTPFSLKNIDAIKKLRKIIEIGGYDLVYCHTAMGAVVARMAARKARKDNKTKVIYVAHGFHFFKGSPKLYWAIYYPMEKFLSRYTDAIVTINREDYELVCNSGFKNLHTYRIDGIGVNDSRFFVATPQQKEELRAKNGLKNDDFVLIYIAEYIHRKNHKFIIDSVSELSLEIPTLKVLFAGRGVLMEQMKEYAVQLGVENYIHFLGFRTDIPELVALSDVGVSASRQEGLGLNLIEEMFAAIPVVASEDRGHNEIVIDGKNGYLFGQHDKVGFLKKITALYSQPQLRAVMGKNAAESVQKFKLDNAIAQMAKIFNEICN